MPDPHPQTRVVIAGGGVAAVELALALADLAAGRVQLTIVAPDPNFELRPLRTAEPFAADHVRRRPLSALAEEVGAELVAERLIRVDPGEHQLLAGDRTIPYDALVVAVGARRVTAFEKALTFTGDTSTIEHHGLLGGHREGYSQTVRFGGPPGTTWPLP